MKKLVNLSLLALFLSIPAFCLSPTQEAPLTKHLREVNREWQNHEQLQQYHQLAHFVTDVERIQAHLLRVIDLLRSQDVSHLEGQQLQHRQELITTLNSYALRQQFPQNIYHSHRQPYFIDQQGTACAVGYLIIESGHSKLAERISRENNYAYIRELDYPELLTWADEHGFTVDELALIQPGYQPQEPWQPLAEGVDGTVNSITTFNGKVFIGGDFATASGVNSPNVVMWNGNSFEPVGGGLPGAVTALTVADELHATGHFAANGAVYEFATYNVDANKWELQDVLQHSTGAADGFYSIYSYHYITGWTEEDGQTKYYLARKHMDARTWTIAAWFDAPVHAITATENDLFVGGAFKTLNDTISAPFVIRCTNCLISKDAPQWEPAGSGFTAPVRAFEYLYPALYAGGDFYDQDGEPAIALARWTNGDWQPIIDTMHYVPDMAFISDIMFHYKTDQLLVAGDFVVPAFSMVSSGRNLATVDLVGGLLINKGSFDSNIYSMEQFGDIIYVGGDFQSHNSTPVNHIAALDESNTAIAPDIAEVSAKVFPNPFRSQTTIQVDGLGNYSGNSDVQLRLFSPLGQQVEASYQVNGNSILLQRESLAAGVYVYEIRLDGKSVARGRLVAE